MVSSVGAEQTSSGRLCPPQGARVLLMDGTAVESAFALLLTKVTKPPYPAKDFLNIAIVGVNKNYVPYLALVLRM